MDTETCSIRNWGFKTAQKCLKDTLIISGIDFGPSYVHFRYHQGLRETLKPRTKSLQSFAYDTEELELIWDSDNINAAKKENNDALFMDISLVNNMPKFKIIDHGYNFSTTKFMLNEEGPQNNRGNFWKLFI